MLGGDDAWVPVELIGTRIAKRRHVLGLTQEQLGDAVGVARDTISMWERDKQYPHRHLGKLEDVLGVSFDDAAADPNIAALNSLDLDPVKLAKMVEAYRDIVSNGGPRSTRAG